jgi:dTDP-4-amino-4,6-dideoxygalactose transaminase
MSRAHSDDSMQVPLLDLPLQNASIREDILSARARVHDSQQFIMGPGVEQLEYEVAPAIGVPHSVAVSSGTDALTVALMAFDIGEDA